MTPDLFAAMSTPQTTSPPSNSPRRGAQAALGLLLVLGLGLLALRGYGNGIGSKPSESSPTALTDLNRAPRAELEQIPGIGPGLAKKIDDRRREKGPFTSLEELRLVKGIGPATFDKVRPYLMVDSSLAAPPAPSLEPLVLERRPTSASPALPRSGGKSKLQPGDPPVDVSAAGVEQLMTIPGVGPVTARNIVAARAEKPFRSVEDLDRVKGIGKKTLEKIRPFVVVK